MAVCVKDCEGEHEAIDVVGEEAILEATSVQLAANVVQEAYGGKRGEILEELFNEGEGVVLFLASGGHVGKPKNAIVTAKYCHQSRVGEVLSARLHTSFICCDEGIIAALEDGDWDSHAGLKPVSLRRIGPCRLSGRSSRVATLQSHSCSHLLNDAVGKEHRVRVMEWRVLGIRLAVSPPFLREVPVDTHYHIRFARSERNFGSVDVVNRYGSTLTADGPCEIHDQSILGTDFEGKLMHALEGEGWADSLCRLDAPRRRRHVHVRPRCRGRDWREWCGRRHLGVRQRCELVPRLCWTRGAQETRQIELQLARYQSCAERSGVSDCPDSQTISTPW